MAPPVFSIGTGRMCVAIHLILRLCLLWVPGSRAYYEPDRAILLLDGWCGHT